MSFREYAIPLHPKSRNKQYTNMQNKFDINEVMRYYGLNRKEVEKAIFPDAKYPRQAFDRILRGDAVLNTTQLELLADYAGVLVPDLFLIGTWKSEIDKNVITLIKGDYKVKLNYNSCFLTILEHGNVIYQLLRDFRAMSVKEFINYIDNLLFDYEDGKL